MVLRVVDVGRAVLDVGAGPWYNGVEAYGQSRSLGLRPCCSNIVIGIRIGRNYPRFKALIDPRVSMITTSQYSRC